jgi:hypothetical protein
MVMDSVTKKTETKQTLAQQYEEHQFWIDLDAEILMAMAGQTQQMAGRLTHTGLQIHSQPKHFSGVILTQMDLETYLLVLCEMIVQKSLGPRLEMFKAVKIRMTMGGQMNMANGMLPLPSWVKTQLLLG